MKVVTGIRNQAHRGARLVVGDVSLLMTVAVIQVCIVSALRVMSLPALRTQAARFRKLAKLVMSGSEERLPWALEITGHRLGCFSTCLVRALAAEFVLGSLGYSTRLTIGVRRRPQGVLEGHAWLECHGRIVIGSIAGTPNDYVPFAHWTNIR